MAPIWAYVIFESMGIIEILSSQYYLENQSKD